jgi:phosphoribosylaminoimidazole-succinocarboxamide synthase
MTAPIAISETPLELPYTTSLYRGKVRDVYDIGGEVLVLVASDRISAFDVVLPRPIPSKGQVLNQTAAHFLRAVDSAQGGPVRTHLLAVPDENVMIGIRCEAYPIEMVVRGYLAGHAWRTYRKGGRLLCGVPLPEGLKENDPLPEPIVTPTTKSKVGHDIDISETELIRAGLLSGDDYAELKYYTLELYALGQRMAQERGLILVDTKYEFGQRDGQVFLIDEVHTPDSSRYFYAEGYEARQQAGEKQEQLSKEFVREWLMAQGFQGQAGVEPPVMPDAFVQTVSARYIELYERVTGQQFVPRPVPTAEAARTQMTERIMEALEKIGVMPN